MTELPRRPQVPPNSDLTLGMECIDKSEPGVTVWTMPAVDRFANPMGVVQGGFLAALADSAMAASTITGQRGRRVAAANTELKISFLRPAPVGGTLRCTARVLSSGRRVTFVEAEIVGEDGRLLAKASSTYLVTAREPEAGAEPS